MQDLDLLAIAIKAALLAGREIMQWYTFPCKIQTKKDQSPITQADISANDIIVEKLKHTKIPIISEECYLSGIDYTDTFWLVDPLDGTKEFINKNGEFTVNIALIENQKPLLGVVYAPAKHLLYFASPTTQAIRAKINPYTIQSESLQSLPITNDTSSLIRIVASRSHLNIETDAFISVIQNKHKHTEVVYTGSSLKLCLIAEGRADIYPRFGKTMEWDTAAGHALLLYTNAELYTTDTLEPLKYGKKNFINPSFIAIRKNIHLD